MRTGVSCFFFFGFAVALGLYQSGSVRAKEPMPSEESTASWTPEFSLDSPVAFTSPVENLFSNQSAWPEIWPISLLLEVFLDGFSTGILATFLQQEDGTFLVNPQELENLNLSTLGDAPIREDGLIDLGDIPGVSYEYRVLSQSMHLTSSPEVRSLLLIDGGGRGRLVPDVQRDPGILLNYSLNASGGRNAGASWAYQGLQVGLEGRWFGSYGTLSTTAVLAMPQGGGVDFARTSTLWSYSDVDRQLTWRVGDVSVGGAGGTRSVALGGFQLQRDFSLRPGARTIPLTEFSGIAEVPSTVNVYINDRIYSSWPIPAGPFQITNLPISASGLLRVTLVDSAGNETTLIERPHYSSPGLLAPGLLDFTAGVGFPRQSGSSGYTGPVVANYAFRYGLNETLTLEGHTEVSPNLLLGGLGAVFSGTLGTTSVSATASQSAAGFGAQFGVGWGTRWGAWSFSAFSRRTVGDFRDLAAVEMGAAVPNKVHDQVSVSVILPLINIPLNLRYDHRVSANDDRLTTFRASIRRTWQVTPSSRVSISAFQNFGDADSYGVSVSGSIRFGGGISSSLRVTTNSSGTTFNAGVQRRDSGNVGDYSWNVQVSRSASNTQYLGNFGYLAPFANFQANLGYSPGGQYSTSLQMSGAVVAMGGGVFLTRYVNDALALVDAGVPGAAIMFGNRLAGHTDSGGRMIVPNLISYDENVISIDPLSLPFDMLVHGVASRTAVPANQGGVSISFDVEAVPPAALVMLRDEGGRFLEVGSVGWLEGMEEDLFIVGYDGLAFITGLSAFNRAIIERPNGGRCVAEFFYEPQPGEQVFVEVVCTPY